MKSLTIVCLFLMLLNVALAARRFRCRQNKKGWGGGNTCLYASEPDLSEIDGRYQVYCNPNNTRGGDVSTFEFPDENTPLCITILFEIRIALDELQLMLQGLHRSAWGVVGSNLDESRVQTCYDLCNYFKDGITVSISAITAKPRYVGCYTRENGNSEDISRVNLPNEVDCELPNWGRTPTPPPSPSGISAGWILVIVLCVMVVVIAVGAGAFYYFKVRDQGFSFGGFQFKAGDTGNAAAGAAPSAGAGGSSSFVPSVALDSEQGRV